MRPRPSDGFQIPVAPGATQAGVTGTMVIDSLHIKVRVHWEQPLPDVITGPVLHAIVKDPRSGQQIKSVPFEIDDEPVLVPDTGEPGKVFPSLLPCWKKPTGCPLKADMTDLGSEPCEIVITS